jgi:threonine dehydrogenase-like Zn-dependent dehydrogenase
MAEVTLMKDAVPSVPATMMAAVITAPGQSEVRKVNVPNPGPNQALIRLEGTGVCASNIPPWEGREWFSYPMEPGALGHEGWGRVVALGSAVRDFSVGQRVAFLSSHAYAEYDVADDDAMIHIPEDIGPFPAEPLGCAMNIYRRSGIKPGDTVAIVGIGFLGALLTKLASDDGARVLAVSRRPFSLDRARRMGAAEAIPMEDHHAIIERVKDLTSGKFCDVVIEAVGKQWPLDLSAELCKERGRLIVAGFHQDGPRQVNMFLWNWRGLDVINAHEREPAIYLQGMREAVEAVRSGRLDPRPLFTHTYDLAHLGDALDATKNRPDGFMKALVLANS